MISPSNIGRNPNRHSSHDDIHARTPSLRRLRPLHYRASQASSPDALPLIPNSQPTACVPSPPYHPQPHQLIAVCFNNMAGRQCDHCQQLNEAFNKLDGKDRNSGSDATLGTQHRPPSEQSNNGSDVGEDEKPKDGGERGDAKEPPSPVGILHKSLSKLRLQVFGLWARTSQLPQFRISNTSMLMIAQP